MFCLLCGSVRTRLFPQVMRYLFHFPQLYDVPLSFLHFVAGAPAVPAEVGGSGRTGRLGWKRASLPRPLGIEVLKGGGLRALLGGKKGALWRESPFCASACRMTSSGGCCVAISVTLRRRAVQHTHFAHGRCEAAASAGSAGIFVSAWTIAGRALPIARVAGLGAFASLSCSGSSPEL